MITPTEIYVLALVGVAGLTAIIGYEIGYLRGRGLEHQRWYRAFERLRPDAQNAFRNGLDDET